MFANKRFISALIIFASLSVSLPLVCAQNETHYTTSNEGVCIKNETSCISNYAELKQALFDSDTGNMERLLYTFTVINSPIPHYVWVFYFHNQSTEWQDILKCPSSNNLQRCPASTNVTGVSEHVFFWADSPLLKHMDILFFKFLIYNSLLHYLGMGACVELVVPPFCDSVDKELEINLLELATSYVSFKQCTTLYHIYTRFSCFFFYYYCRCVYRAPLSYRTTPLSKCVRLKY